MHQQAFLSSFVEVPLRGLKMLASLLVEIFLASIDLTLGHLRYRCSETLAVSDRVRNLVAVDLPRLPKGEGSPHPQKSFILRDSASGKSLSILYLGPAIMETDRRGLTSATVLAFFVKQLRKHVKVFPKCKSSD